MHDYMQGTRMLLQLVARGGLLECPLVQNEENWENLESFERLRISVPRFHNVMVGYGGL